MAKDTVSDEPSGSAEKDSGEGDWISGYIASDVVAANSPNEPQNQIFQRNGGSAIAYKAHWKNKQPIFPWGSNDEGGK